LTAVPVRRVDAPATGLGRPGPGDPLALAAWLLELARSGGSLVRSYLPASSVDARTRERIILAVAEGSGSRWCAWVHGAWADYLGTSPEADERTAADRALLDYARACAEAGRPLDPSPLRAVLPPAAVAAVRATVAQLEVSSHADRSVDGVLARLSGRRPLDVPGLVVDAATAAVALPVTVPLLATGAAMRLVARLAPAIPVVEQPAEEEANLLVHVLAQAVPSYLANAGVRLALLRLPVPVAIGIRSGRSAATLTVGRNRVRLANGVGPDAVVVLEGDIDPLLQLATGSMLRELPTLRLRRD